MIQTISTSIHMIPQDGLTMSVWRCIPFPMTAVTDEDGHWTAIPSKIDVVVRKTCLPQFAQYAERREEPPDLETFQRSVFYQHIPDVELPLADITEAQVIKLLPSSRVIPPPVSMAGPSGT